MDKGENRSKNHSGKNKQSAPPRRSAEKAASGAPKSGWAVGDRFSWEEVYQRLLAAADEEINAPARELFSSATTAGFAIALTLIGHSVGAAAFPDNVFLSQLLYPTGFLYIILGRYQLYTENTMPPVKLALTRMASLPLLFKLWIIVLISNLLGAAAGSFLIARFTILSPEALAKAVSFAPEALNLDWWSLFFRSLFAGWLVAGVIWINTASRDNASRFLTVYFVFYAMAVCKLYHVVPAGAEAFVVLFAPGSQIEFSSLFFDFWLPVLLGNTAGGVLTFSLMAYVQTETKRYPTIRELSLRDMFLSFKGGKPFKTPPPEPDWKQKNP